MKLKPVFASILLLGVSGVSLADTTSTTTSSTTTVATPSVQDQLSSMQLQLNQVEQTINQNGGGTQTGGGTSLQSSLGTSSAWYNSIAVSGLANVDAITSSRDVVANDGSSYALQPPSSVFGSGSKSDMTLSNADVFVDAQVNDWTKAHIGLNYQSDYLNNVDDFNPNDGSLVIKNVSGPILDEGYITFANFSQSPLYLRVGQQYLNFGNYDRYAAVPTFTQLLSQTDATAATLGVVENMFYASVYGFRGLDSDGSMGLNDFGGQVGISNHNQSFGYNLSASYLNNLIDTEYVGATNTIPGGIAYIPFTEAGYTDKVGGLSVDGSFNIGIFDANAHWVTALNDFSGYDLVTTSNNYFTTSGARPEAITAGVGVSYNVMGYQSRLGVDYQHSWQAENVGLYGLPQDRYEGTYNLAISKNVNIGLDVYHDVDYDNQDGGSDRSSTTGLLRFGVLFA